MQAEFDKIAEDYYNLHNSNLKLTGETSEYFAEYKIKDLFDLTNDQKLSSKTIFDFGCGIGNSIPYFRKYFPKSNLNLGDVSIRSMDIAKSRFPGQEQYVNISDKIPVDSNTQDIVFSACVFHHIPHDLHSHWFNELMRITKKGGIMMIYEHNPNNPLTVSAVNTCPFDENAVLVNANKLKSQLLLLGWRNVEIRYRVFFPSKLKWLRFLEAYLTKLPIGGQWYIKAQK